MFLSLLGALLCSHCPQPNVLFVYTGYPGLSHVQYRGVHHSSWLRPGRLQGQWRLSAIWEQRGILWAPSIDAAGLQAPGRSSHFELCEW